MKNSIDDLSRRGERDLRSEINYIKWDDKCTDGQLDIEFNKETEDCFRGADAFAFLGTLLAINLRVIAYQLPV